MLLQPNKTKHKKTQKNKLKFFDYKSNRVVHGTYGLKAKFAGHISAKSLESARQAINKYVKSQKGKLWIKIYPNIPITAKPVEVRMGKGKGSVHHWSAKVSRGTVIFEVSGINDSIAFIAFKNGSTRLPVKTSMFKN